MTDYSNWKVKKSVINYTGEDEEKQAQAHSAQAEYTAVAAWCNENGYTIEEQNENYVAIKIPQPSAEEKAAGLRTTRNAYLIKYVDPYICNPLRWADMAEAQKQEIEDYRQYLLDIPQQDDFLQTNIKTFEEWKRG